MVISHTSLVSPLRIETSETRSRSYEVVGFAGLSLVCTKSWATR